MSSPIRPSDIPRIPEDLRIKPEPSPNRTVLRIGDKSYEVVALELEKGSGWKITSKATMTQHLAKRIEEHVEKLIRCKEFDPNKESKLDGNLIILKPSASNSLGSPKQILQELGRLIARVLGIAPSISAQDSGNREAQRQIIQNVIKNPSELNTPKTREFVLTQLLEFHEKKGCPSQKISERLVLLHAAIEAAGGIGEDTQKALLQLSKDCPNSKNVFGSSPTINGDPLKALQHEIHEAYKKANPGSRNISADFGKYALTEGLSNPDLSGIYQGYIMKALNVLINKANTESSRIDAAINHAVERPSDNSNQEIAAICADLLKTPTDSRQQLPAQTSRAEVPPSGMITSGPAAPSISSQHQTPPPQTATRAAIHSVKPAAPAQQRTKITSGELRANVYTIASTNLQVDTKEARIMNRIIQYLTNAFLDNNQMPDNIKSILKLNITATSPITTLEKASLVTYYADLIDLIDNGRPEAPTSQSPSRTSSRGTTSRPTLPSGVVTEPPAGITSSTRPAPSISSQHQTPPPQTATRAPTQIVKPAAPATPLATGEIRRSDPPGSLIIESPPDGDCAAHSIVNQLQQRNILKADGSQFTDQREVRSLASTELERIAETLANASGDTPDSALADQIIISIQEAYEKINKQPQSLRPTLQSIRKLIEKYKDPKGQLSSAEKTTLLQAYAKCINTPNFWLDVGFFGIVAKALDKQIVVLTQGSNPSLLPTISSKFPDKEINVDSALFIHFNATQSTAGNHYDSISTAHTDKLSTLVKKDNEAKIDTFIYEINAQKNKKNDFREKISAVLSQLDQLKESYPTAFQAISDLIAEKYQPRNPQSEMTEKNWLEIALTLTKAEIQTKIASMAKKTP